MWAIPLCGLLIGGDDCKNPLTTTTTSKSFVNKSRYRKSRGSCIYVYGGSLRTRGTQPTNGFGPLIIALIIVSRLLFRQRDVWWPSGMKGGVAAVVIALVFICESIDCKFPPTCLHCLDASLNRAPHSTPGDPLSHANLRPTYGTWTNRYITLCV